MHRRALLAVLSTICIPGWLAPSAVAEPARDRPSWPFEIRTEHKPGTYWWCPGSAFDKASIDFNLETMAKAGIGTAHIVPIYGANGYEDRFIRYLSPTWMTMLDHIVTKARDLGMNVDMTTGTGWCFGGPGLDQSTADIVARYDPKTGKLSFSAKRMVKRAAPGGEGHMLNPYSPGAMRFYLKRFNKAFDQAEPAMPRAQYHDSFEYSGNWSTELLEAFKARHGYDLADHLDVFFAKRGNPDTRTRLKYDYRATLADLHVRFIETWSEWARKRGMITRNQAHGSPTNLVDTYAAADIPETEMFGAPDYPIPGFRRNPDMVRKGDSDRRVCMLPASAAHIAHEPGKQWVSSESCTWLREHWHTALSHVKLELDEFFIAGVNHVFFHGTCYSPTDVPWPGFFFYASTKFDWRNSIWHDMPLLNAYIARCQSVLQAGEPDNDILVYWPIHDLWMNPKGTAMKLTVHHAGWVDNQHFGDVLQRLIDRGYGFDVISDRLLKGIDVRDGKLRATGGTYRTVLVPSCKTVPVATLTKLADLADKGATIIIEKEIPSDVPGLARLDERRARLKTERARLAGAKPLVTDDLEAALAKADARREPLVDAGLEFIRRRIDGDPVLFVVNQTAKALDGWLTVGTPCRSAALLDPMASKTGTLAVRQRGDRSQVYLQLHPGQSCFLRTSAKQLGGDPWTYLKPGGKTVEVAGSWQVDFLEGGPNRPASYKLDKLASWTEAPDDEAQRFAGTARYRVKLPKIDAAAADDWVLDLGDVRESARVHVNGRFVGGVFALPKRIRIGPHLKPGENTLQIEVTNLTANRIRNLDRRGATWKIMKDINIVTVHYREITPATWPLVESGLLGPVRLVPMTKLTP